MSEESETIDSSSGSLGMAMASFAVSINTLIVLSDRGLMTPTDSLEVIRRAHGLLQNSGGFQGDPDALVVALESLDAARQLFEAATAQKPSGGQH